MAIDSKALKRLIEKELQGISDTRVVAHIRAMLVEPSILLEDWADREVELQYSTWLLLKDPNSVVEIVYREWPKFPWGLTGVSNGKRQSPDWFRTFLDPFFESLASVELPIWRVFRIEPDKTRTPITEPGAWDATWAQVYELRKSDPKAYECGHSIAYER